MATKEKAKAEKGSKGSNNRNHRAARERVCVSKEDKRMFAGCHKSIFISLMAARKAAKFAKPIMAEGRESRTPR
jgi:hypothetical protein